MKLDESFRHIRAALKQAGVEASELEAEWIIEHLTGLDAIERIKRPEKTIDASLLDRASQFVERRATGEPLAYILGEKYFFGLPFKVTPDVLIPRPETELLVERALEWLQDHTTPRDDVSILDLGVGSGCIAITLLKLLPEIKAVGIDISGAALEVAKQNAILHKVSDRLVCLAGDAAQAGQMTEQRFDLILANPPYISPDDRQIQKSVAEFEPAGALYSPNGTDMARAWIQQVPILLKPGGAVGFEIGPKQANTIMGFLDECQIFSQHNIIQDYGARDRIVWAQTAPASAQV